VLVDEPVSSDETAPLPPAAFREWPAIVLESTPTALKSLLLFFRMQSRQDVLITAMLREGDLEAASGGLGGLQEYELPMMGDDHEEPSLAASVSC
jgi:hypothetical protein